jgi:predicted permease
VNILIDIIIPVFGLALLGFTAAKLGWFEASGIRGLSSIVFNFAIPVMLFRTHGRCRCNLYGFFILQSEWSPAADRGLTV